MDDFYLNPWQSWGCAGAGLAVAGITLLICAGVMAALFWIFRRANRRFSPGQPPPNRRLAWIFWGGIGAIFLVTVTATTQFSTTLHRATVTPGALRLEYCDGLSSRTETILKSAIRQIDHQEIWEDPHSPVLKHYLAIVLNDETVHFVPLSTNMADAQVRALHRAAPPDALSAWKAALLYHGAKAPDRIFAPSR